MSIYIYIYTGRCLSANVAVFNALQLVQSLWRRPKLPEVIQKKNHQRESKPKHKTIYFSSDIHKGALPTLSLFLFSARVYLDDGAVDSDAAPGMHDKRLDGYIGTGIAIEIKTKRGR